MRRSRMPIAAGIGVIAALAALSGAETRADGSVTLDIIDASVGGDRYTSIGAVESKGYRSFISGVVDGFAASGAMVNRRFGAATAQDAGSTLIFRRTPLVTSGEARFPSPPPPPAAPAGACHVATPWFTFTVTQGAGRRIRGVFHWSERQILRDRAALVGVPVDVIPPAMPLPRSTFDRLAERYADELMRDDRKAGDAGVPADLLWLFRTAPQATFGPFANSAEGQMETLAATAAPYYVRLAATLAQRCRAGKTAITIRTISEALRIVPA